MVEIPYSREKAYRITDANGTRNQAINGLPTTNDMLLAIQNMNGFDFVVLCMYCLDNPKKEKDIICYFFLPRAVVQGIKQQNIKPVYSFEFLNPFGLPFQTDVRFPTDKYKIDNDNITVTAVVTQKRKCLDNRVYGSNSLAVNSHVNFLAIYLRITYNKCKGDDDYAKY